jgi:hypothetical protein
MTDDKIAGKYPHLYTHFTKCLNIIYTYLFHHPVIEKVSLNSMNRDVYKVITIFSGISGVR